MVQTRKKYNKPGNVFCGVVHRLDRPTTGALVFAKTSKAIYSGEIPAIFTYNHTLRN